MANINNEVRNEDLRDIIAHVPQYRSQAIDQLRGRPDLEIEDWKYLVKFSMLNAEEAAEELILHAKKAEDLDVIWGRISSKDLRYRAGRAILDMKGYGRTRYAKVAENVPELAKEAISLIYFHGPKDEYDLYLLWPNCSESHKPGVWQSFSPSRDTIEKIMKEAVDRELVDLAFIEFIENPLQNIWEFSDFFSIPYVCDKIWDWAKVHKRLDRDFLAKATEYGSLLQERAFEEFRKLHLRQSVEAWLRELEKMIRLEKDDRWTWVGQKAQTEIFNYARTPDHLQSILALEPMELKEEAARRILAMIPEAEPTT